MSERHTDILIVGGGTGGCAAAMAAAALGRRVILTEETDWLGGQLTSQAVPPDEHPWIEQFGCTRRYRRFRELVRSYYRDHYPLTARARFDPTLNPGGGSVSRLCCEPRVALAAIEQQLAWPRATGRLEVLLDHVPTSAQTDGDRVTAVTLENRKEGGTVTITADIVIDATELGDLLALAGVEYVSGAESQADHGEPHAVSGPPQPDNVQAFTWCFPAAYDPHADHVIDRPADYDIWRDYVPPVMPDWPGKLLAWHYSSPSTLQPRALTLFAEGAPAGSYVLWNYRRIVCSGHYEPGEMPHEVTLVNWPQNDYLEGNLIDAAPDDAARYLREAKQLSLSLLHWLQTEAPRPDGGAGYPGLYLRPDLTGTADGLAKYPYVRESRRIVAEFTVTENHIGTEARDGGPAEVFADSVGIGSYRCDLHPSTGGDNYIDFSSQPFQIPLGALLPVRVDNLLPACKNLGVTHLTNGCYRLHPVEWNIGEAAGLLAAHALNRGLPPRAIRSNEHELAEFQTLLRQQGLELAWPQLRPR